MIEELISDLLTESERYKGRTEELLLMAVKTIEDLDHQLHVSKLVSKELSDQLKEVQEEING